MTSKKQKLVKYSFFFFLCLTVYYSFVWLVLPFFADPQVHRFEKYNRILNWDLRRHAMGDFDNDGQKDLISFTGCAFLSAVDINAIPQEQQCTAIGIAVMTFKGQKDRIGQKYVQTDKFDLNLGVLDKELPISHSFIAKDRNENWKIFVNSSSGLNIYEVKNNGLLQNVGKVALTNRIDEYLYSISRFFVLFALPIIPLSFIFTPIFAPFRSVSNQVPIHEVITLSLITIILFVVWRGSYKTKS
ncbi:MAG: hypothetical protein AAB656_00510 [Patescibacteria group bacterium]